MPNKHAAIKDLRKNRKRAERNSRMKTHVKALSKSFTSLMGEGKREDAAKNMPALQQALGKAAKNNVMHPNKAARKISALHKKLNVKK